MFPIRDDQPRFSTPFVNYFIIGLNIAVYLLIEPPVHSQALEDLTAQFGLIPYALTRAVSGAPHYPIAASLLTIFTSMFLHEDFLHIVGNLWFLWVFGDNIEDYLGHFPYLIFYLLCGVVAALTDVAINPLSKVPMIGASGAIAGIMGAYIVLFPRSRVQTLVILIVFITFWWLPAWVFLGYWFLLQFIASSVTAAAANHQTGGIAFAAHVGGFVAGLIMIKIFPRRARSYRYGTW